MCGVVSQTSHYKAATHIILHKHYIIVSTQWFKSGFRASKHLTRISFLTETQALLLFYYCTVYMCEYQCVQLFLDKWVYLSVGMWMCVCLCGCGRGCVCVCGLEHYTFSPLSCLTVVQPSQPRQSARVSSRNYTCLSANNLEQCWLFVYLSVYLSVSQPAITASISAKYLLSHTLSCPVSVSIWSIHTWVQSHFYSLCWTALISAVE